MRRTPVMSRRSGTGTESVTRTTSFFADVGDQEARSARPSAGRTRLLRMGRFWLGRGILRSLEPGVHLQERNVIVLDLAVVRRQAERLEVLPIGLLEPAEALVGDREVVAQAGIPGVVLHRFFPAEQRFTPETLLGRLDAELHELAR